MRRKGFTITELIIVITVIGILAGIVMVAYNGTLNRGNDSVVQSDLETIAAQLESYRVNPNNPGEFPHTTAVLGTLGIKATKNAYQTTAAANLIYCTNASYQTFALVAKSRSNTIFMITEGGAKPYPLTDADFTSAALCPALSMTFIAAGMTAPNTWATWVGN
jgi:prepilin-type N-terminal cleavage/methylation domain-containing protein